MIPVHVILLLPCIWGKRVQPYLPSISSNSDYFAREEESAKRTHARFASAFPEMRAASSNCPYGSEDDSTIGGLTSFQCHWKSPGMGSSCPALQADRLKAARRFQSSTYAEFVDNADGYPLKPVFDKSAKIVGDETYEALDKFQIEGLMHEDVAQVEDKILLKSLAKDLGVPATTAFYGSHKSDWSPETFKNAVKGLCTDGVDSFMIKATHLAWSNGMKLVRGWQETCHASDADRRIAELAEFIETEVLGQIASEADAHLRLYLEPGVTVEELFRTGGQSVQPLEAKTVVLWGKVHHMFLIGSDSRGCRTQSGAWQIYGDKTGWDLNGMIGASDTWLFEGGSDPLNRRILNNAFDRMVEYAEKFAQGVGADMMRVDFFLGIPEDPKADIVIKMNECESVSGHPYWHERQGIGGMWRDGYVLSDRLSMTPDKWAKLNNNTWDDRSAWKLD